ncbi:cobalt ABC transporter, inner membrane subunit CbiQ [Desulfatibacillum aliphaticivorans]|uniref:Cobalt ABC transporter, inner membrane subunit CbiQ n=1 Tax=Desulfatibacillum aliphaticivorans TaxID=218208 RepID=B8FG21_DESAL|nr:cobalt ECF transporter T component CbiQ [Desulfatibacillum aliphaticivorans]ACL03701.1 cobalt ABC transporter, inner membrane subunit CbiQ [Desulfatibacillum aliphaticivorans]
MIAETFAFGESPVHRLDPRLRVIVGTLFAVVAALADRFDVLGAALGLAILMTFAARLHPLSVLKRLALVNGLVLFLWVVLPFTYNGTPWFHLGPLVAAKEGVRLCAVITLKSNAIVLWSIVFFSTMPVATLGHAMNRLKMPVKLTALLLLTYRYIFVLEAELNQLVRAARIRSFSPKTNMHTYRTYAYLVGMLMVRAADRGERVHQAMVCRGFSGKFYCLDEMEFTFRDAAWGGFLVLVIFFLAIWQWTL